MRYNHVIKAGKMYFRPCGRTRRCGSSASKAGGAAFGPCIRQLRSIVAAPAFNNFIMFCIICSSLSLAFDMPQVEKGSDTAVTLELLDYLFTTIFVVEMCLKIVAYGACTAPDGYFLDGWNVLDSFIVITSVISLAAAGVEFLSVFRSMRAVRTLRPLRVISATPRRDGH